MKKIFNLKMTENASVAQHLNEFNTITNQLSSVEIDFDDEIRALIVLASLPNSWEAMRMAVSNSTGKEKLKYNDIRDLILAEEIRRRDAGETSIYGSALNLETGTLYMTSSPRDTIAVADASTDTSLWHHILGHMSEKGMKMLLSKGKLPELKSIDFDMCENCILGKQKKVSFFKTGRTPKVEKLELVHTDLWGPSPVASLSGSRYYIIFINDSSRKV